MSFSRTMAEQKNILSAELRREAVLKLLSEAAAPLSASVLAARFSVSRQIIVGDIALLRAAGADISATPRGYLLSAAKAGLSYTVACIHSTEEMEKELNIIVDNGCTVLDVTVEHAVYGQISGKLELSSRYEVSQFIEKLRTEDAPPLSSLTGGVHLHTLLCPNEAAFSRVCSALKQQGLLFEN